jgi:uncharacterized protein (DUF58 family)
MYATSRRTRNLAVVVAGLCMFIVALFRVSNMQSQLFLMSTTVVLLPAVSYIIGRFSLSGLVCTRDKVSIGHAGDQIRVVLTVENASWLPKFYLYLSDRLPKWVDVDEHAPPVLQLWPGQTASTSAVIEAEKRGVYAIGPLAVQTMDPLGFRSYRRTLDVEAQLIVYPRPIPIRIVETDTLAQGAPAREVGALRGAGGDFYGLRDYVCGDELRRVHWPTTARLGRMSVVEQTQATAREIVVALDLSRAAYKDSGDGPESALEYAVTIAASLCKHYIQSGYILSFIAGPADETLAYRNGRCNDLFEVLDYLARVEADSPRSLAETLNKNRSSIPSGATLIVVSARSGSGTPAPLPEGMHQGREVIRFEIDGGSFVRDFAPRRDDDSSAPAPRQAGGMIRGGDNLREAIEGILYARK